MPKISISGKILGQNVPYRTFDALADATPLPLPFLSSGQCHLASYRRSSPKVLGLRPHDRVGIWHHSRPVSMASFANRNRTGPFSADRVPTDSSIGELPVTRSAPPSAVRGTTTKNAARSPKLEVT